jgi:hypothetical protein
MNFCSNSSGVLQSSGVHAIQAPLVTSMRAKLDTDSLLFQHAYIFRGFYLLYGKHLWEFFARVLSCKLQIRQSLTFFCSFLSAQSLTLFQ